MMSDDHTVPLFVEGYVLKRENVVSPPSVRVPRKPTKSNSSKRVNYYASPIAQAISLPNGKSPGLSPQYKHTLGVSYIEQCFDKITIIGEGSYGIVFRALSKDDGKYYAVKKFKDKFRSMVHRNNRLKEVHRYGSIPQSEYCVEFIRAWEEDAHLFIQMELCSLTLEQYIRENSTINEDKLWNILLDLLLGVKHLHTLQFVHLDIKPDNILVSKNDVFKLGDFGLMLDLSKGSVEDAEEGDSRYLAPEVLGGTFSKAADIFSIGMTMLEIACNIELPSSGILWHELRRGNLPRHHFNTSDEFFDLVKYMITPKFAERPSVEELLKHKRFNTMQRNRHLRSLLYGMTSAIKSLYSYGKTVACNYSLGMFSPFRPFSSRVFGLTSVKEHDNLQQMQMNNGGVSSTSPPYVSDEPISFRVRAPSCRLEACKRRIFLDDDDEESGDGNSCVGDRSFMTGNSFVRNSPKKRRLFQ